MEIRIEQLLSGARKANGLTVIIDVFRAATTACFIYAQGARRIIAVEDVTEAFRLKEVNPDHLLIGEVEGVKVEGFDHGNSPTDISGLDLSEKTILHRTSSGTRGLINATNATEILMAGFVNAGATVNYILEKDPDIVTLVCMGWAGVKNTLEDDLCAGYIRDSLEGVETDYAAINERIRTSYCSSRFFAGDPSFPESDYHLCMDLDRFPYVLKAGRTGDHMELELSIRQVDEL